MSNINDIRRGNKDNCIYQSCIDCGKLRWVILRKGNPISVRCHRCATSLQSYKDKMSKAKSPCLEQRIGTSR